MRNKNSQTPIDIKKAMNKGIMSSSRFLPTKLRVEAPRVEKVELYRAFRCCCPMNNTSRFINALTKASKPAVAKMPIC